MNKWLFRIFIGPLDPSMFKSKPAPEKEVKNIQFPETKIGTPIGHLFGTKLIPEPPVVWWGDLKIIKHKLEDSGGKK